MLLLIKNIVCDICNLQPKINYMLWDYFFKKIEYRFNDWLILDQCDCPLVLDLLSISFIWNPCKKIIISVICGKLSKIYVKPIWKIVLFIVVDVYNTPKKYICLCKQVKHCQLEMSTTSSPKRRKIEALKMDIGRKLGSQNL